MQTAGYTRCRRAGRSGQINGVYRHPEASPIEEPRLRVREVRYAGTARMPYVNAAMQPVYRETAVEGERVRLLRKREDSEKRKIKQPASEQGVRYDVMIGLMTALCVLLLVIFLVNRGGYWAAMDRVRRADAGIRETEKRIAQLQTEIDQASAALNVPYEAVKIGMVASSSMPVISLYAPMDAITLPNGEVDPAAGVLSASNP